MKLPAKKARRAILFALLVAVGLAAAFSQDRPHENVGKAAPAADERSTDKPGAAPAAAPGDLDLSLLKRRPQASEIANAFQGTSWYVPPPPPPPPPPAIPVPPPPPTAPPLPFTYLGRYQEAAKPIFFLVRGDSILSVSEGDVIDGAYRVDGLEGAVLNLTYLPLNIKQTLSIGDAG